MSGTEQVAGAGRVVADYWAAAEARDWGAFGALLAEDVVYEVPQTRERVSGRGAYVRFNAEGFPGDWHLAARRIVSQDRTIWAGDSDEPAVLPAGAIPALLEAWLLLPLDATWT